MNDQQPDREGPVEIALVGDLTENQADLTDKLLEVAPGGECILHIDSSGGSAYVAVALATLIRLRGLKATGVVVCECSSARCGRLRPANVATSLRTAFFLFHPIKWQSDENVGIAEAAEWARHFSQFEGEMDVLLAELFGVPVEQLRPWLNPGRYVSGRELVEAGMAEMIPLAPLPELCRPPAVPRRRQGR